MNQILWEKLRELIAKQIGFRIRSQDMQYFHEKIETRIQTLKLKTLQEYYLLLYRFTTNRNKSSQEKKIAEKEWKSLANIITNGESFFFRDRGQFNLLKNTIIPQLIANKCKIQAQGYSPFLTLKIWSAGCSTGEEVYSLAMLISELISDPAQWHISIIGTDINQDFLALARQGIYKQWSFRLTEPLFKSKYFIAHYNSWMVKPHLKGMVSFYQDNLIDLDKISHYTYDLDLVLCRNVFIYFEADSIAKAVNKISKTLRPGGYFISGHAELQNIELSGFKLLNFPESIVYQYLGENQEYSHLENKDLSLENFIKQTELTLEENQAELISLTTEQTSLLDKSEATNSTVSNLEESDSLENQFKIIEDLLKEQKNTEVIQQTEKLIQEYNQTKELYYFIAQAYFLENNLEQAQINCDRALAIDSIYVEPMSILATIAMQQHNYRKAKELLKKIIYLEPLSVNAYLDLAAIYAQEKDRKRSQKMYQTAYDLLQKSEKNLKNDYQGITNVRELLTQIKSKL